MIVCVCVYVCFFSALYYTHGYGFFVIAIDKCVITTPDDFLRICVFN